MSQQPPKPSGTIKKTKQKLPLSPLLAKAKSRKPLLLKSCSPDNPDDPPSFLLTSPTPSLRWRSKPSIKNCYHEVSENPGPSGTTNMLDTSSPIDAISSHRYDRLRASLHSTIIPAVIPKESMVAKKPPKFMMASKSVSAKPDKQTAGPASLEGSIQNIPVNPKRRYWVPTPTEMAKIGDKIPKAFVKTSLTSRKTVAIPTDNRTWLHGNPTPIESSTSVTENQVNLVRGARLLNKKPKKKDKKSPPPPPHPSHGAAGKKASKSSKNEPPAAAGNKPAKSSKKDLPPKPPAAPAKTKKPKDISSKTSEKSSRTYHSKRRHSRPFKLNTIYVSTATRLHIRRGESSSTHSLPPPYTSTESPKSRPDKNIPATTVSLGFSTFVECFYCHVRYPIDVLRGHQDECCHELLRKHAREARTPLDYVEAHFKNSFHKLNFDGSCCNLAAHDGQPPCIEECSRLSALPSKVSSNEALNKTCWYCGWEYGPEILDSHMAECAAVRGNIRPTAEGRRLRRLVERKIKTYARLNPKKKNLWC